MLSQAKRATGRAVVTVAKRHVATDPTSASSQAIKNAQRPIQIDNPSPVVSLFYPKKSTLPAQSKVTAWDQKLDHYYHAHHGPNVMSRESELPVGDWRRKPMTFNWTRMPETNYERWIHANVQRHEKYFSHLTKGEFIVHMRRLAIEQRGNVNMWYRALTFMMMMGPMALCSYSYWTPEDPKEYSFEERQYMNILKAAPLIGPSSQLHKSHQERLVDFFAEHDEEDIAKLPKGLQEVYYKYKDEYNASL